MMIIYQCDNVITVTDNLLVYIETPFTDRTLDLKNSDVIKDLKETLHDCNESLDWLADFLKEKYPEWFI